MITTEATVTVIPLPAYRLTRGDVCDRVDGRRATHLVVMDALGVSAATPLCPACAAGVLLAAGQTVAGVTAGHSDADLAPCDVRGE